MGIQEALTGITKKKERESEMGSGWNKDKMFRKDAKSLSGEMTRK